MRRVESVSYSDGTLYQQYGSKMLDGEVPYRDFKMEYPPGATAMFVLPATSVFAGGSTEGASWVPPNKPARRYYGGFTSLVLLLVGAMIVLTALTSRRMGRSARMIVLSLAVVGFSPLTIGQVLPERFDVLPAALTALALALAVREHYLVAAGVLGLAIATKLYPVLILLVLVVVVLRQRGARQALGTAGTAVAVATCIYLPFAITSV